MIKMEMKYIYQELLTNSGDNYDKKFIIKIILHLS